MGDLKKNKLALIITLIFFLAIGVVFFKYKLNTDYVKVSKLFENSSVITGKTITDKTINIEIAAKMIQGDGIKSCENRTELNGTISIDNNKYELKGARCTKTGNNNFTCIVTGENNNCNAKYKCWISGDLNSIVLESHNGSESIVYPAKDAEEALNLKSKLLGNK